MNSRTWAIALTTASLLLAGCVLDDDASESRDDDDGRARQFVVDVPNGATQLHVDVSGRATGGEPDATVLIEDQNGANLASDTFSASAQRRVTANVDGHDRLTVTVRVIDGDAELDVRVSATVPGAQPVIVVEERVVIVQVERAPVATTPAATPPAATTPAPAPAPTPTTPAAPTPPDNSTNTTNETNATG